MLVVGLSCTRGIGRWLPAAIVAVPGNAQCACGTLERMKNSLRRKRLCQSVCVKSAWSPTNLPR